MIVPANRDGQEKKMDFDRMAAFIRKQKVAFICSVDEDGYPNVKAMLKPRKIDGLHRFYFSISLLVFV